VLCGCVDLCSREREVKGRRAGNGGLKGSHVTLKLCSSFDIFCTLALPEAACTGRPGWPSRARLG